MGDAPSEAHDDVDSEPGQSEDGEWMDGWTDAWRWKITMIVYKLNVDDGVR